MISTRNLYKNVILCISLRKMFDYFAVGMFFCIGRSKKFNFSLKLENYFVILLFLFYQSG